MINKNDPRLTAFVLGELDDTERQELQTALDQQPELLAEVQQIQNASNQLQSFFGSETDLELTAEQHEQLKTELATPGDIEVSRREAERSKYDQRTGSRRFWFIAASILGLLLIGWMFREPLIDQVAVRDHNFHDAYVESGRDLSLIHI